MDPGIAVRRICVAVDMENYSGRNDHAQAQAQRRLAALLDRAHATAPPSALAFRQRSGDGEVSLFHPGMDEVRFFADFVHSLWTGLQEDGPPLRLRMAVHCGIAWVGDNGMVGRAVVKTCRMVDSAPLREALASDPETPLALMVSDPFFDDVVRNDPPGLSSSGFVQVRFTSPKGDLSGDGWVWRGASLRTEVVPVEAAPPSAPVEAPAPPAQAVSPLTAMSVTVHPGAQVGTVIQVAEVIGGINLSAGTS